VNDRPNILVVMTDDHGQWATGCYGNKEIHTPTLDHLASTGTRFANAFTPTPVCSPARASFLTGRLPSQHGMHDFLEETLPEVNSRAWLRDEVTLAQLFREAGYECALSGKWHCGGSEERQPGFDRWFQTQRYEVPGRLYPRNSPDAPIENQTQAITDNAVAFLRERDPHRPFFLFVGYTATHSPWTGHPERLVSQYRGATFEEVPDGPMYRFGSQARESTSETRCNRRQALTQYYAAVSEVDEGLGRILDELDTQGLRESTTIVYTADHGLSCGHHGIWGKGNGTDPQNALEQSIRVPLIVSLPDAGFPGQVRTELVDHCDVFQALLDLVGIVLSLADREKRRYPGRSFAPLLRGEALPDWKDRVFGEYGNLRMVRTRKHKLVRRYPNGPHELYDLMADPLEEANLFFEEDQKARVQELTASLDEFFAYYEDPSKSGLPVRELPRHNSMEAWRSATVDSATRPEAIRGGSIGGSIRRHR
jgi:arylsulfatase A-like enzyme